MVSADSTMLLLDIGSGTQDALYYNAAVPFENSPKFVVPSPAKLVAKQIVELTHKRQNIYLYGCNMGGGFWGALQKHMDAGLQVAAHPEAALAIHDDLQRVEGLGVAVADLCPCNYAPVELGDFSSSWWRAYLGMAGLEYPDVVLAAAQDHGVHETMGNREGRFEIWRELIEIHNGDPAALIYNKAPEQMTRLVRLQQSIGGGPVADSAAAALLGVMTMQDVVKRSNREGVLVVNVGNSHTVAFLMYKERICGVYEHHTGMRSSDELVHDLQEFRFGWLTNDMVRDSGGHGCLCQDLPEEAEGFRPAYVVGPQRAILHRQGQFVAPGSDMMLTGCFGLLKGIALQKGACFYL